MSRKASLARASKLIGFGSRHGRHCLDVGAGNKSLSTRAR
jgi:hypothetical protein